MLPDCDIKNMRLYGFGGQAVRFLRNLAVGWMRDGGQMSAGQGGHCDCIQGPSGPDSSLGAAWPGPAHGGRSFRSTWKRAVTMDPILAAERRAMMEAEVGIEPAYTELQSAA